VLCNSWCLSCPLNWTESARHISKSPVCIRRWWYSHKQTPFSVDVSPPSSQWTMWWMCKCRCAVQPVNWQCLSRLTMAVLIEAGQTRVLPPMLIGSSLCVSSVVILQSHIIFFAVAKETGPVPSITGVFNGRSAGFARAGSNAARKASVLSTSCCVFCDAVLLVNSTWFWFRLWLLVSVLTPIESVALHSTRVESWCIKFSSLELIRVEL